MTMAIPTMNFIEKLFFRKSHLPHARPKMAKPKKTWYGRMADRV